VSGAPPTADELYEAQQVGRLDLSDRLLTKLPLEVCRLTGLQRLNLSNNQLTTLPPEIGQLTSLQMLNLADNQLTTLPPEIGQLTSLQTLIVDRNQLTTLPPEIGQFTSLQKLSVDRNELTTLPPEISRLTSLQSLSVRHNLLNVLPTQLNRLTWLGEMWLDSNCLTALPREIGKLTSLQSLILDNNQIKELPKEIASLLVQGLVIHLNGNPLREPLPEIIGRGQHALAIYLNSLEDAIRQYDAKVLLVGEGNVGKTSLIAALRNEPFIEGRPTTHGIEIQPLTFRHPSLDVEMTLRAWDFGGQEVYRITHQFFFSRRTLYLVVWNAREGQEQNEVEGWLRRIRLRVGLNARAMLVATHCDERHPELDYPHLQRTFPDLLACQYEIDNRSGRGVSSLREGIAAEVARLPQMGKLVSLRWIDARDEVLARAATEPLIPYEEFADICQRHHVQSDEVATLADLLHDLGQIIYYGDDEGLRDFVVLNPEWLTKAISYVLEDALTRQSDGVLDHARLREIWQGRQDAPSYPVRYHPYFLRLMEKFDVSYRLEDDEYRSLVAQLVRHDRADVPWDFDIPPHEGIRRLALVCELSEPVPGLIAWLTVRHHRATTGRHWRRGVFLRHPIAAYESEALVELTAPDQLVIDVRAPAPDLFFNVLRDSLEDLITRRWPGLSYQLFIPCPTRTPGGQTCRGKFPLEGLLGYREKGGTRAPCWKCHIDHDISKLLTGFGQPDLPLQLELERLHDQVADMGRGVCRLEGYAAETAGSVRRVLQAVSTEVTDCPRLFTLTHENPIGTRRLKFYQRHYRLVLWCEHPGYWHPWSPATYSIDESKDWLVRIGPYATMVFKALQLVVPIATSAAYIGLTANQLRGAQNELQLMKALVAGLPNKAVIDQDDPTAREFESQLTRPQGEALRGIRMMIFEHDRMRAFGDLRRFQEPSGDFLWVCPDHYTDYDPGLPSIP
jgi:internalin A